MVYTGTNTVFRRGGGWFSEKSFDFAFVSCIAAKSSRRLEENQSVFDVRVETQATGLRTCSCRGMSRSSREARWYKTEWSRGETCGFQTNRTLGSLHLWSLHESKELQTQRRAAKEYFSDTLFNLICSQIKTAHLSVPLLEKTWKPFEDPRCLKTRWRQFKTKGMWFETLTFEDVPLFQLLRRRSLA